MKAVIRACSRAGWDSKGWARSSKWGGAFGAAFIACTLVGMAVPAAANPVSMGTAAAPARPIGTHPHATTFSYTTPGTEEWMEDLRQCVLQGDTRCLQSLLQPSPDLATTQAAVKPSEKTRPRTQLPPDPTIAWDVSNLPSPSPFSLMLSDSCAPGSSFCVGVGESGGNVLIENYLGTHPLGSYVPDGADSTDWKVMVGDSSFGPIFGSWDGTSWNVAAVTASTLASFVPISVSCLSSAWCLAVGGQLSGTGAAPASATFDGTSWELQGPISTPPGSNIGVGSVSCTSTDFCAAMGNYMATVGYYTNPFTGITAPEKMQQPSLVSIRVRWRYCHRQSGRIWGSVLCPAAERG